MPAGAISRWGVGTVRGTRVRRRPEASVDRASGGPRRSRVACRVDGRVRSRCGRAWTASPDGRPSRRRRCCELDRPRFRPAGPPRGSTQRRPHRERRWRNPPSDPGIRLRVLGGRRGTSAAPPGAPRRSRRRARSRPARFPRGGSDAAGPPRPPRAPTRPAWARSRGPGAAAAGRGQSPSVTRCRRRVRARDRRTRTETGSIRRILPASSALIPRSSTRTSA